MNMIVEAESFAEDAHSGQKRKSTNRPYILHPIQVMQIVKGLTEDEEVIAAAVLHDTLEDTSVTRDDLVKAFGKRVADLVAAVSEDKRKDQPAETTWLERKEETIEHMKTADRDVKLICLGDKLSNIRMIAMDYAVIGDEVWQRFNQKDKNMHRWYYTELYKILREEFGNIEEIHDYRNLLEKVFGWEGE